MLRMNELKLNEEAIIYLVKADDSIKKRFLDIGLVKGTKVKKVLISPGNDMVAYLIKGAIIAIRKDDTKDILVRKVS